MALQNGQNKQNKKTKQNKQTNKQKNKCTFIQFDIKEFYITHILHDSYYLYITEDILENAITFAKTFISINNSDLRIVKHCRKLLQNYCSLVKKFGRKCPQQAFSTLPWKAITAPKYINLSVSTSYHTFKQ